MEEPVGYIFEGNLYNKEEECKDVFGDNKPQPVYSQKQIEKLFLSIYGRRENVLRHTIVVDWNVINEAFKNFGCGGDGYK